VTFAKTHDLYFPYQRYQRLLILSGTAAQVKIMGMNLGTGQGAKRAFLGATYHLLCDKVRVASVTIPANTFTATFTVDATRLSQGWHHFDIEGGVDGESAQPLWAFVKHDATVGEQPFTPISRGQYERSLSATSNIDMWVKAPGRYAPTPKPILTRRTYQAPPSQLLRRDLHCEQLVPIRTGDMYRPNRSAEGILSTFDGQAYFWSTLHAAKPTLALLDGPRGVGTLSMATHMALSTAAPDGRPRNNVYFCDPWRVGKISEDGTITTLVGYRHRNNTLTHWEDSTHAAGLELIGDWSAVPETRRGFHELWGMAWDERTLQINEAVPRIATEGNEHPHFSGPVMFVSDSQRNRVCRIEFSATQHGVPPKVTEFITGLLDPWDIVYANGLIYVSERQSHRIAAYDAVTGALRKVVVQGQPLASVDINREVRLISTLAVAQAAPCVAPEGLYLQDGWLYFASKAQAQVRRVHLTTGALEVVRAIGIDGNSKFAKLAVSDGTFGPRGTTFTWTWSIAQYGHAQVVFPNGTQMPAWWPTTGGTGQWKEHCGYATCGAVGQGRLISAGMVEGVMRISRTQTGDMAPSAAAERGRLEYVKRGLHLLHGTNGFGFYGVPQPWGLSADIDAFLESYGHVKT
jgi:hypothetical protein